MACSGCVAKVTPSLSENPDIKAWNVDTTNPAKVLTVQTESLDEGDIKGLIQKAGFKAESLV